MFRPNRRSWAFLVPERDDFRLEPLSRSTSFFDRMIQTYGDAAFGHHALIHSLLRWEDRDFVGQCLHPDRTIIQCNVAVVVAPGEGMLHPVLVVAVRVVIM